MRNLARLSTVFFYILLFVFLVKTFSFVPDKLADVLKHLSGRLGIK